MTHRLLTPLASALVIALAACASSKPATTPTTTPPTVDADGKPVPADFETKAKGAAEKAALSPLNDLNVVRDDIPPVLVEAAKAPYLPVSGRGAELCEAITVQTKALDAVLGPDLDVPRKTVSGDFVDRNLDGADDEVLGGLQGAVNSAIPYRGLVRKLTGAEKLSREVSAAVMAGAVRRAYLKGVGQAQGCPPPAAPRAIGPAATASSATVR